MSGTALAVLVAGVIDVSSAPSHNSQALTSSASLVPSVASADAYVDLPPRPRYDPSRASRSRPVRPALPPLPHVTCWNGKVVIEHPNVQDCPSRPKPKVTVQHYAAATGSAKQYALSLVGAAQFSCLEPLWQRESEWNVHSANSSGAYGIPQALPGSKMASAGADWRDNAYTQIRWGVGYIKGRYGTPCNAWAHSNAYGWY